MHETKDENGIICLSMIFVKISKEYHYELIDEIRELFGLEKNYPYRLFITQKEDRLVNYNISLCGEYIFL